MAPLYSLVSDDMKVLVTGGAGFIGVHVVLTLLEMGFDVVVLDNLSNSKSASISRISQITGRAPIFIEGDIRDKNLLLKIFSEQSIDAVFHFAGLKSVGDSVIKPLDYYDNNVEGSIALLQAMSAAGVFKFVFSSSATVYGDVAEIPVSELSQTRPPANPYARSKLFVEEILGDLARSDSRWQIAVLRYFNPVGAHESGMIGEDPSGIPNNLLPYITRVAIGKLPELLIFGNDFPTIDGTGVRDYIHVMDLAQGHLSALNVIQERRGVHIWNLGTGRGYSVLDVVRAFEEASHQSIPYRVAPRRLGDVAACYADPAKANHDLNWKAVRNLHDMMRDAWRWQQMNPDGYK